MIIKKKSLRLVLLALFIAIGIVLPIAFHSVGLFGSIFCPMHIPVLLAGFFLGGTLGALSAVTIVFLSSLITGMPPLFPVAVYMAAELVAYAISFALLSKKMPVIPSLVISMIIGRVVLGIVQFIILSAKGGTFVFTVFLTQAFVTALPAIIIQLTLIPSLINILKKQGLLHMNI